MDSSPRSSAQRDTLNATLCTQPSHLSRVTSAFNATRTSRLSKNDSNPNVVATKYYSWRKKNKILFEPRIFFARKKLANFCVFSYEYFNVKRGELWFWNLKIKFLSKLPIGAFIKAIFIFSYFSILVQSWSIAYNINSISVEKYHYNLLWRKLNAPWVLSVI